MWAPQRLINRAGRPRHPDLYATEIPTALTELGVRFTMYAGPRGYEGLVKWTRRALEAGDPVILGVKILPTQHPDWGLDHFVLAVGHGPKGLLVNTTWGTRQWVADTTTTGLSLANGFYGIRLSDLGNKPRAHASLVEEGEKMVKIRVSCAGADDRIVETRADAVARFTCP
jgi:hypothetical protein